MHRGFHSIASILFGMGLLTCAAQGASSPLKWKQVASGVWRAEVGRPDRLNLLNAAQVSPKNEALQQMAAAEFPLPPQEIQATLQEGKSLLRFPLEKEERIFGLGLHFKTVDQRGRILRLHVDHYGGNDNGRTHAPVPFYVSSRGYGLLVNAARYIDLWVGTAVRKESRNPPAVRDRNTDKQWSSRPYSDNVEILIPSPGVELYLFAGPTPLDAVRRFNLYSGGGCLPPRWGLGFWHRTPTLYTADQVGAEVAEFERRGFPLTVIGLEPGWQSRSYPCTYEWDPGRFPDPAGFLADLQKRGVSVNLWMNPFVSPESSLAEALRPHTASHTVWAGLVPDYTLPAVQQLLSRHFEKQHLDVGVSGYKMDENDGYDHWLWPDVAQFPSGVPAEQMRQVYGVLMQRMTTAMFRRRNQRSYGLVRASNAGATSFPYAIYNDYYSHPDFITALINSSFIGVLWTPEVRGSKTAEEWLRRMQTVCFSPLAMLNAWSDGTKPWSFAEVEQQVHDIARLRMQLIPYLYTAFADYAFYGTPPMRAMNLEEGFQAAVQETAGRLNSSENPYAEAVRREIKDQFMVGDFLLVAPLFAGQNRRQVVLPQGQWFDFYTGEPVGGGVLLTVSPGLDRIPVFVKDGGIIPMMPPVTKITDQKLPLEIRHYGRREGLFQLYDDDGRSYDYERGAYARIALRAIRDDKGKLQGTVQMRPGAKQWSYSEFNWRFMTAPQQP